MHTFPLRFGTEIRQVSKIEPCHFQALHHEVLDRLEYAEGRLIFSDTRWRAAYLGMGEEKAVYCVCDHEQHVFALEVINENSYLNGRLVDGAYFFEKRIPGLTNIRPQAEALYRYRFTGLVKAREFVYGYTWDRFQWDARCPGWLDGILTSWFQGVFRGKFDFYRTRYRDVHDRNLMFEIRQRGAPGYPVMFRDCTGHLRFGVVGLRPIDVR